MKQVEVNGRLYEIREPTLGYFVYLRMLKSFNESVKSVEDLESIQKRIDFAVEKLLNLIQPTPKGEDQIILIQKIGDYLVERFGFMEKNVEFFRQESPQNSRPIGSTPSREAEHNFGGR